MTSPADVGDGLVAGAVGWGVDVGLGLGVGYGVGVGVGAVAGAMTCPGPGVFKIRLVVGSARCTVSVVGSREDATVLSAVNCVGCSVGVAPGRGTAVGGTVVGSSGGGTRVDVDRMLGGTLSVTTILRVGCGPEHPTANAAKDNANTENASFPLMLKHTLQGL